MRSQCPPFWVESEISPVAVLPERVFQLENCGRQSGVGRLHGHTRKSMGFPRTLTVQNAAQLGPQRCAGPEVPKICPFLAKPQVPPAKVLEPYGSRTRERICAKRASGIKRPVKNECFGASLEVAKEGWAGALGPVDGSKDSMPLSPASRRRLSHSPPCWVRSHSFSRPIHSRAVSTTFLGMSSSPSCPDGPEGCESDSVAAERPMARCWRGRRRW